MTNEDIERAAKLTVTPETMTGAAMSRLNAIEAFWTDIIHPYIHQHETLPLRLLAMASLGDRLIGGLDQCPDFESRDNGVLRQVDLISFEQIPLKVAGTAGAV